MSMSSMLSKNDIFYFEIVNGDAITGVLNNVDVEVIDFVEAVKLKYSNDHERVELEQNKALGSITEELLLIKKVLAYLGSNIVGPDVSDDSFESLYRKHVIIGIEDIDGYCDMMATKLMKDLEEHKVTIIKEGAVLSELDILYWYLNETYQYDERKKESESWRIVLCDIYEIICDFLSKFRVLLEIKTIYLDFFNYVLDKQPLIEEEKKKINIFFLQYEILVLFDFFFTHLSCKEGFMYSSYHKFKGGKDISLSVFYRDFLLYCHRNCKDEFKVFLPEVSIMFKVDCLYDVIVLSLIDKYRNTSQQQLCSEMCAAIGSRLFVDADVSKEKKRYTFFFDSSIVDLAYVADISTSLTYFFVKPSIFFTKFFQRYENNK
jgi:hypothetical protein